MQSGFTEISGWVCFKALNQLAPDALECFHDRIQIILIMIGIVSFPVGHISRTQHLRTRLEIIQSTREQRLQIEQVTDVFLDAPIASGLDG